MYYKLFKVQYLYKDQYGKQIFVAPANTQSMILLMKKIEKYSTINPIYQKDVDSDIIIKFNDTKHSFKSRVFYDLIYFIHRTKNPKTNKTYINVHISDAKQCNKKELEKVKIEDLQPIVLNFAINKDPT